MHIALSSRRAGRRLLGSAFLTPVWAGSASAATLTWTATPAVTPPADGTGTWDLATTNWYNPTTGSNQAWNNGNLDTATFSVGSTATASTVTIAANTNIVVGGITFNGSNPTYTIAGGSGATLTLGGTAPLITVNRSSVISVPLAGSSGLTTTGSGTLGISAAATYTGDTTILSGAIQPRGVTNALPIGTTVILGAAGTTTNATLDVRSNTRVAGLSALGTSLTTKTITNNQVTGITTLTVNPDGAGTNAADSVFGGVIKDGSTTNLLALTQAGSHTLILSGANTYTGATTVSGGTLLVNGSTGASAVGVSGTSATLGGAGTIGGATTVCVANGGTASAGILTVGASSNAGTVGALTFSTTLTLNSNASTQLDIVGTAGKGVAGGNDLVNVAGGLVYNGTLTVTVGGGATAGTYDLFDFATQSGTFTAITVTDGTTTYGSSFDYGNGVLTITAVPEPSTWAAGALCLAAMGWVCRRHRRTVRA